LRNADLVVTLSNRAGHVRPLQSGMNVVGARHASPGHYGVNLKSEMPTSSLPCLRGRTCPAPTEWDERCRGEACLARPLRRELEIRNADFVVTLHQESEFALRKVAIRLGPIVESDPLLVFLDALDQVIW